MVPSLQEGPKVPSTAVFAPAAGAKVPTSESVTGDFIVLQNPRGIRNPVRNPVGASPFPES